MAIPQPMIMPQQQAQPLPDFESKTKELKEAHNKELEKIRAEIHEIETRQNEKIGTLTVDLGNRSNKEEVDALYQRVEALTKKLPPSQTSILESVKKSLTEIKAEENELGSGDDKIEKKKSKSRHKLSNEDLSFGDGDLQYTVTENISTELPETAHSNLPLSTEHDQATPTLPTSEPRRPPKTTLWGLLKNG